MTTEKNMTKSFVKSGNEATIICPKCNLAKTISVTQFRNRQHLLKVKCKCGNRFKIQLEFRRHYRKDTDLTGTYELKTPATGGGLVKISNLSLSGVCFLVRGIHNIKTGQRGTLNFTLDNRKQTVLFKNVIIRSVDKGRIGCEFVDDQAFEKELGFYLRP